MQRWPFLEAGTFRYAFQSPEGGALHCRKIAAGIAGWLRKNGAAVYENSKVAAVDADHGKVELADGAILQADRVVVTAGAWVLKLFPDLDGELKTYRTAVVYLDPPADLAKAWHAAPVILDVGGKIDGYIIPPSGGAGLKFGSGLHKVATSDADWNRVAGRRRGRGDPRPVLAADRPHRANTGCREVVTCAYTFTAGRALCRLGARPLPDRLGLLGPWLQVRRGGRPAGCRGGGGRRFDALKRWLRAEA